MLGLLGIAGLCLGSSTTAFGVIVDLTQPASSGTVNGALFQQINQQAAGTGVLNPFLRIKDNAGAVAGYNTDVKKVLQNDDAWTKDLKLSEIGVVNGYRQFVLDINQQNSDSLLSLNQIQIWIGSAPAGGDGALNADYKLSGLNGFNKIWDLNPSGGTGNGILLDYALNPGSGAADMLMSVPNSLFVGGDYVVLFSQFGTPPGANDNNDGFEEWASASPVVPEPSTLIAGALLLLPFGVSALRVLRKKA